MPAVPDRLDLDSDNDCMSDRKEGVPEWRIRNCSQDCGLCNIIPTPADSDGDGEEL